MAATHVRGTGADTMVTVITSMEIRARSACNVRHLTGPVPVTATAAANLSKRSQRPVVGVRRRCQSGSAELAPRLTGLLSLVPPALLDSGLPLLQQLGGWLASYFPLLLTWAGYLVWLVWGLGMLVLLLLGALARRFLLSDTPDRLPPRA